MRGSVPSHTRCRQWCAHSPHMIHCWLSLFFPGYPLMGQPGSKTSCSTITMPRASAAKPAAPAGLTKLLQDWLDASVPKPAALASIKVLQALIAPPALPAALASEQELGQQPRPACAASVKELGHSSPAWPQLELPVVLAHGRRLKSQDGAWDAPPPGLEQGTSSVTWSMRPCEAMLQSGACCEEWHMPEITLSGWYCRAGCRSSACWHCRRHLEGTLAQKQHPEKDLQ